MSARKPRSSAKPSPAARPARRLKHAAPSRPKSAETTSGPAIAGLAQAILEVAENLRLTQVAFAEALLRLPRPEDHEPRTQRLHELARLAPALIGLPASSGSGVTASPPRVADALQAIAAARSAVDRAIETLPPPAQYEPVARQLRAIATVSPSLLDWLNEVPVLSAPLADSVDALRAARADLDSAREALLGADQPPEDDEGPPPKPKLRFIVRG
jgi:hypothetical protein